MTSMAIKIETQQEFFALAVGFARAQLAGGIRVEAAVRFAVISAILLLLGLPVPAIISGKRTLDQQRQLKKQADPFGIPVAERSWHVVGLAYDLDTGSPSIEMFGRLWRILGGRVGADFQRQDPGHFDLPIDGVVPPSI